MQLHVHAYTVYVSSTEYWFKMIANVTTVMKMEPSFTTCTDGFAFPNGLWGNQLYSISWPFHADGPWINVVVSNIEANAKTLILVAHFPEESILMFSGYISVFRSNLLQKTLVCLRTSHQVTYRKKKTVAITSIGVTIWWYNIVSWYEDPNMMHSCTQAHIKIQSIQSVMIIINE